MAASSFGGDDKVHNPVDQRLKWHRTAYVGIQQFACDPGMLAQGSSQVGNTEWLRSTKLSCLSIGRADEEISGIIMLLG